MDNDFLFRVKPLTYEDMVARRESDLPYEVFELEKENMYLSKDIVPIVEENYNPYCFLYHGIRFQRHLEKLENIFKDKKILAGKYTTNNFDYSDNCNKGEYVSLTTYDDNSQGFKIFIVQNISLLVSPKCEAYLTKYVDYNIWKQIKDKKTKNLYSYMQEEFMCKDCIDIELIKAVGVPYEYYMVFKGIEYADNILNDVKNLIDKYQLNIPIVDTSNYNKILIESKKEDIGVNYGKNI